MKKVLSLFMLPLISAGHTGAPEIVESSSGNFNFPLLVFVLIGTTFIYYMLKGGSKNEA